MRLKTSHRAFVRVPKHGNDLPLTIRSAESVPFFRSLLKTYFYRKPFLISVDLPTALFIFFCNIAQFNCFGFIEFIVFVKCEAL